jgi:Protein of unknown function (DUF1573)
MPKFLGSRQTGTNGYPNALPSLPEYRIVGEDVHMRYFPRLLHSIMVAGLLCGLPTAIAWAQEIHCSPCSNGFGQVNIGASSTYTFELSNVGNRTLNITAKSDSNHAFALGSFPTPVKIAPGASVPLSVTFAPTAKGYTNGNITIVSNDPDSPLYIHVHGVGVYPDEAELQVSPASLNFPNTTVGSTATMSATLKAVNGSVTISSDQSTSSEFVIVGLTLPVTISAGQSLPVTVQFTPNSSGQATAKAGFVSTALDSPTVAPLSGTGVAAAAHNVTLSWQPGSSSAVGFNVFRSTASGGPFQQINSALDSSTNYTDSTVAAGMTYYYVTTEVNAQGQQSSYSNMAEAVIP